MHSLSIDGWLLPSSVRCLFQALQALARQQDSQSPTRAAAAQAAGAGSAEAPGAATLVFNARLTTHPQTLYFDAAMERAARERSARDRRTVSFGLGAGASASTADADVAGSIVAMETVVGWLTAAAGDSAQGAGAQDSDNDSDAGRGRRCDKAGCAHNSGGPGCELEGAQHFFRVIESRAARP